ncbi:MAG TPA: CoA transferase [Streptosporangiaceae bacterium]|nr:CoA transferase [Streptosporangiaceae bacterium]
MSVTWPSSSSSAGRPLRGIKVLDASRILAGPYCAMLLADLGADVIKVEPPAGDETRRWGPPFLGETAAYYFVANRNKWDLMLDLKQPGDRATMRELIRQADVVIHNYTGERARGFALDYESVRAVNDQAICLSISGFGATESDRRGYDVIVQALGGLMSVTGPDAGPPSKVGVAISDIATGLYGALGVVAALAARAAAGKGTSVEVSLYDATLSLLTNQAMNWLLSGEVPQRHGNDHPNVSPYGLYVTGDGDIVLAVATDVQFAALCTALGCPALAGDERFLHNSDRVRHRRELRDELEARLAAQDAAAWSAELDRHGIPNGVVRSVAEALNAPESRSVSYVDHDAYGRIPQVLSPIRIDGEYLGPYLPPPERDEHRNLITGKAAEDD